MLIFKKMTVVSLFLLAVIFLWPKLALAQDLFGLNRLNEIIVSSDKDIFDTIAGIINVILGLLGAITVLLFLYAGWLWMTSQGARDRIDQAKKIMINAAIGIGIIFVSYALVNFIFRSAYDGIFGNGNDGDDNGNGGGFYNGATLGSVLDNHYPGSNASNIARNTNIIVTFREPIQLDQIRSDNNCNPETTDCDVNTNNIMLYPAGNTSVLSAMTFRTDATHKNFTFNPQIDLGNDRTAVIYTARLNNLRTGNDQAAFTAGSGAWGSNSYYWSFSVGTWLDAVSPYVVSVIPQDTTVARNTIVQINFSESINPIDIPAIAEASANIRISDDAGLINGTFHLSNQYRTVEFTTNQTCGINSCGLNMFCLPATADIAGYIEDALRDTTGNQLDGDGDGTYEGATDDKTWSFTTDNNIDLTGPLMISHDENDNWGINDPLTITFDSTLSANSVNRDTVSLSGVDYWLGLNNSGLTDVAGNIVPNNRINITHSSFLPNTNYDISCTSGVTDLQQNCYQCNVN